jgi:hypothetical protein
VTSSFRLALAGLAVGILGLVVQWIADPAKFGGFPPGIAVIAVCGLLVVLLRRRWWSPIFAVLVSLWIVFGGWAAGKLMPNFGSDNAGTVTGTAVMVLGLLTAAITGIIAMVTRRR